MATFLRDDMGRELVFAHPPRRLVSLVPSETETLFELGLGERVVGRTRYCVEPAGSVDDIPVCGGTKDADVDQIVALEPDLVLANQEENSRPVLEALAGRGVRIFVSFPKRVADAVRHTARLARLFQVEARAKPLIEECYRTLRAEPPARVGGVFVPIWREPLMTFGANTYASDLLHLVGLSNVFSDRQRKYPLGADLALRSPLPADQVANRDLRYPRIREAELVERAPDWILLPDEPYEFGDEDRSYFLSLDTPASRSSRVVFVDGKDLFWCGSRGPRALSRLRAQFR